MVFLSKVLQMNNMKYSKDEKRKMSQQRALKNRMKKKPVYKSGMRGGQPVDYSRMRKGIITSLD